MHLGNPEENEGEIMTTETVHILVFSFLRLYYLLLSSVCKCCTDSYHYKINSELLRLWDKAQHSLIHEYLEKYSTTNQLKFLY